MMENHAQVVEKVSGDRVLQFLRELREANPVSVKVDVHTPEWIHDYPDVEHLMACANEQGLIDAFPKGEAGQDEQGRSYFWEVTLRPKLVQILKSRKVHRQVTVDGQVTDLRTMVGRMLFTTEIANLADACRIWLADLKNERKATARRKVRILLSRAVGIRGQELAGYDPALKARVMEALCESQEGKESGY